MKNARFKTRLGFAIKGVRGAWKSEASFRTHAVLAGGAIGVLVLLRPEPIWWAIFLLTIGSVLALELINTSLEHIADRLHPEKHPMIEKAKDCAAAAVLMLSCVAIGVFLALLVDVYV